MLEAYDDLLTAEEACEALKVGKNALYALLASGQLKGYRNGRVWRIPKDAFWRGDYTHEKVEWDGTL